jgi:hypothetical protein
VRKTSKRLKGTLHITYLSMISGEMSHRKRHSIKIYDACKSSGNATTPAPAMHVKCVLTPAFCLHEDIHLQELCQKPETTLWCARDRRNSNRRPNNMTKGTKFDGQDERGFLWRQVSVLPLETHVASNERTIEEIQATATQGNDRTRHRQSVSKRSKARCHCSH